MELRALGPCEVVDGAHTVSLGPKERLLLARLVAARGRDVSIDRLAEVLWGDRQPASARKTIQGYVHRIRRKLGDETVRLRSGGYALGAAVEVDIDAVESTVRAARVAIDERRRDNAAARFAEARERFRGDDLVEWRTTRRPGRCHRSWPSSSSLWRRSRSSTSSIAGATMT